MLRAAAVPVGGLHASALAATTERDEHDILDRPGSLVTASLGEATEMLEGSLREGNGSGATELMLDRDVLGGAAAVAHLGWWRREGSMHAHHLSDHRLWCAGARRSRRSA